MTNEYNKIIRLYNLDNNKSIIKVAEKDLKEYIKNPSQENRKYLTEDYEEVRDTLTDLEGENEEEPNKGKFLKYISELRKLKNELLKIVSKKTVIIHDDMKSVKSIMPNSKREIKIDDIKKKYKFNTEEFIGNIVKKEIQQLRENPNNENAKRLHLDLSNCWSVMTRLEYLNKRPEINNEFDKTIEDLRRLYNIGKECYEDFTNPKFESKKLNCFEIHYQQKNGKEAVKYIHFDKAHPIKQRNIAGDDLYDIIKRLKLNRF